MAEVFTDTSYFVALHNSKDQFQTDCYSFQLMTEQNLTDALTSDPHFRQYGFNILLTDI